ncbi:uncharacterized protein [Haliaeetus albicilla]|uniref:uncharacterized protein n=1 Tax=Haliaeetus albicilla TaxID=8969 RepID=UPI0037E77D09
MLSGFCQRSKQKRQALKRFGMVEGDPVWDNMGTEGKSYYIFLYQEILPKGITLSSSGYDKKPMLQPYAGTGCWRIGNTDRYLASRGGWECLSKKMVFECKSPKMGISSVPECSSVPE